MTPAEIFARLQTLVGDAVSGLVAETPAGVAPAAGAPAARDAFCKVTPDRWHDVALALRDDAELKMDFLQCVTAVDWPKQNQLQVVYHLWSYPLKHSFVVKADLPREAPVVPSVADVWATADWNEREQFDLLGVGFSGHPDLRRILLPDDWPGHPMRKDYKESAKYRGMPTTRPSPLELLLVYDKAPPEKKRLPVVGDDAGDSSQEASDE